MQSPKITKLTIECQNRIRNALCQQFSGGLNGKFIFRRAGKITMESPIIKKFTSSDEIPTIIDSLKSLTQESIKKSVQIDCKSFCGITTTHAIRQEFACTLNAPILFHSQKYKQPNMGMPHISNIYEVITPVEGDLLCIWLSNDTIERRKSYTKNFCPSLEADAWFICSEQFLRAHTLILYEWHDSFNSLIPKNTKVEDREIALRKKLFIGNTLMTNGWLKHKLSLEQSNCEPMSKKESEEKYWHLRSEPVSRNWIDVYASLILMARFGEAPTDFNVPNNNNDGPKRNQWSLPIDFIKDYHIEVEEPFTKPVGREQTRVQVTIKIETSASTTPFRFVNIALAAEWY